MRRAIQRLIPALLTALIPLMFATASQGATSAPSAGAHPDPTFLPVNKAFRLTLQRQGDHVLAHWDIAEGYYLYQQRMGMQIAGTPASKATFSPAPTYKNDPYFGREAVFHHQVTLSKQLTAAPAGPLQVTVRYQGCAEAGLCYPPQTRQLRVSLTKHVNRVKRPTSPISTASVSAIPATATPDSADGLSRFLSHASWPWVIATFFVLGLGLTFTPCVLPMVPILSGIIVGQRERPSMPRAFSLSLAYVLGMSLTYASLGVLVGYFGARANLQAWMQQPPVLILFSALFVLLALSMFGFYELQLPAAVRDRLDALNRRQEGGQLLGVGLMGVLSALVVSPCVSAPLAGALLYISSTGNALFGGLALFVLALGMGAPLLVIGTAGVRILPKAGAWMERVKQAFGVVLLGVALWLLERIVPAPLSLVLWAMLLIGVGIHLGALGNHASGWKRSFQALGLMALVWGIFLLWGAAQGRGSFLQPLGPGLQTASIEPAGPETHFHKLSNPSALTPILAQGKPVMVDFYADWCVSCKLMDQDVFDTPQVAQLQRKLDFVRVDVTHFNAAQQALLNRYGLVGPPAVLFFDGHGREIRPARLVGETSQADFLKDVRQRVLGES
ncbi:protein-disulfide reductase DsbD [Mangrovitalea sediminis]|uniref:protein-disulfide reductase DsbD n=1 Tax=Mangrovitalea sediminis TaxID=1982043 RepID=UPI00130427CA|nr:protein-disulfide reductase DsbD [Mangrovitalea sediminis]